jgi:hypothetical protein
MMTFSWCTLLYTQDTVSHVSYNGVLMKMHFTCTLYDRLVQRSSFKPEQVRNSDKRHLNFLFFERECYMWLLVFICMAAVEMVTKPASCTARWTRNSSLELTTQWEMFALAHVS